MTNRKPSSKKTGDGGGGTIALLNLPEFSVLSMNASASQTLKNKEQLLVISNIQPSCGCHLLVVRGGGRNFGSQNTHDKSTSSGDGAGISLHSIGILVLYPLEEGELDWFVARKFDALTEEISSVPLDEISYKNLKQSIERRENINVSRIIPHDRLFHNNSTMGGGVSQSQNNTNDVWSEFLTHFISRNVLAMHGLTGRGDKIVPGTFSSEDDTFNNVKNNRDLTIKSKKVDEKGEEDGYSLKYPPIPHVDQNQGHRINAHPGTRRFLSTLSPVERTEIFVSMKHTNDSDDDILFQKVLSSYYDGNWKSLLGQLQLSFILFLCCSCLSSLEHWRDTIQMLSLVKSRTIMTHSDLFEQLLIVLRHQLFGFNNDLFDDQEIFDGNCLVPAIRRLCEKCRNQSYNFDLKSSAFDLLKQLQRYVPGIEILEENDQNNMNGLNWLTLNEDCDMEDDGPVVVSIDEINASLERTCNTNNERTKNENKSLYASKYPFLFASMMDNEDILMTCARILDDKLDVTLVREAAAYLEEVESFNS